MHTPDGVTRPSDRAARPSAHAISRNLEQKGPCSGHSQHDFCSTEVQLTHATQKWPVRKIKATSGVCFDMYGVCRHVRSMLVLSVTYGFLTGIAAYSVHMTVFAANSGCFYNTCSVRGTKIDRKVIFETCKKFLANDCSLSGVHLIRETSTR